MQNYGLISSRFMNSYLKYQPPAIQFLAFLTLAGGFFTINYLISTYFFADMTAVMLDKNAVVSADMLVKFKFAQIVSATLSFIVPALLFAYFSSPAPLLYVGVQKTLSPVILLASVVFLFSIQPFVGWLGELNSRTNFGSLQKSIEEIEATYTRIMKVFLQMKSPADLVLNLVVMALIPAIGEELFFRGSLQKVLLRMSHKPWLAIVVSSLIFALLHGTFLKLLPIFTLGLLLGIIFHVTRNLWYTITIHFINNAFAVLAFYYSDRSEILKKLADDKMTVPIYGAIVSLIIGIGIIFLIKRKSDEVLPASITNDDNDYFA
jgi:membrane protease YdiL (CAAX protease family)